MRVSDFDNIIAAERLIIVDFYATWCGACRAMDPTLDRIALAMSDLATLLRIDTTSARSSELVRRYNIVAVPTIMLFYRGDMLWRHSGIISFERLCSVIRRYQTVGAY
ncbi:MAG: thioredoxin family protein [Rikenellaceae bacterium]|nr:thioredoxin family protein [Rikenellaceae bacterium]